MAKRARSLLGAICAGAILAAGAPALAQSSAADKATADALFRAGKDLLDAGKTSEACPKLEESQRIDPRLGTLLNLATCHEQEGKTASAWAEFNDAAAQAANTKHVEREKFARARVEALEKHLSRVTIRLVSPAPGTDVTLDGKPLRSATLGTAIPLDPGPHEIVASAPSRLPWKKSVVVAKGASEQTVDVPELAAESAAVAPGAEPAGPREASSPSRLRPALGLGLFGVGSAVLGAGVFFGLNTLSKRDDAEAQCVGELCTQAGLDTYDEARSSATAATILIPVGIAMMAGGAWLVLFPPKQAQSVAIGPGSIRGKW